MNRRWIIEVTTLAAFAFLGATAIHARAANQGNTAPISIAPATMPRIATVDARYQSYNVEMAEVIGGKFWKPYAAAGKAAMEATPEAAVSGDASAQVVGQNPAMFEARPPIDLSNARLRKLAAALGPAYMRVSGSWANSVYFDDSAGSPRETAPKGFQGVLTRSEWKGVIGFAQAVDAKLMTSFAISAGVRDADGVWTPVQARKLVDYTHAIGGHIAAAEFFNEPDMPTYGGAPKGYDAADYARDFAVFRKFAEAAVPKMRIVGPGSVGEGVLMPLMGGGEGIPGGYVSTVSMLSATPPPKYDVFSYHFYGAASKRCASMGAGAQTTAGAALSNEWLSRTDKAYAFYSALRDRFEPGRPIWITETADAACGGNPWAVTFLDSFRYLDQLGRLAQRGVKVVFHNTLASSEYGLLDQKTFKPRTNYWAALLWHRLMGSTVLDAGTSRPKLHLYAQCLPSRPGGVTVLAINTSRTRPQSIKLPKPSTRYTLTAKKLRDRQVQLNGQQLKLKADGELPSLQGKPVPAGRVELAPASITFLAVADAANGSCR